jgi:glycosyltransferase involved in cell wall biosynthesis
LKRILLVSPFPPYLGGVSVSVQRLYDHLRNSGYSVSRFNTQLTSRRLNRFQTLKMLKYLGLPLFLVFSKRFDIIHFHVSGLFPKMYVALWRRFFSRKTMFVITIHGQVAHLLESGYGKYALRAFDRIICVKKGDQRNMPMQLKPRTVEIPAFIPPVMNDRADLIPVRLKDFLERDSIKMLLNGFIICDSRNHDLYGFMDSVVLLEQLRMKGRNADLIIVVLGSDYNKECRDYLASLKDYCVIKNLGDHVLWVENQDMELWPLIKKVHVFLRPTKSDGDALSIRESLYLQKPVITSDVVPRPAGSIVYKHNSQRDFLEKAIALLDNYDDYVSRLGTLKINFADKIVEQYEN